MEASFCILMAAFRFIDLLFIDLPFGIRPDRDLPAIELASGEERDLPRCPLCNGAFALRIDAFTNLVGCRVAPPVRDLVAHLLGKGDWRD